MGVKLFIIREMVLWHLPLKIHATEMVRLLSRFCETNSMIERWNWDMRKGDREKIEKW